MHTVVLANSGPLLVEDGPRANSSRGARRYEVHIGVRCRGDEAQLLTLAFMGARQTARDRFRANVGLGRLAKRKRKPIQPFAGTGVQK